MKGLVRAALAAVRPVDVLPSPNIWHWPEVYEVENRAQDADGALWAALRGECDWAGRDVVDVGCGDGFHLPVFARDAASVVGVEPHPPLVRRARARVADVPGASVLAGPAQRLPLRDATADLVHARTAYFFGPGCEPGIREADRVLRPGGALAVVDLDGLAPPYGPWLCADEPRYDPVEVERFFAEQGFSLRRVRALWRFERREDLEAVLRIEFSAAVAERALAETPGLSFEVGYRLHVRRKPTGLVLP
ncbi:class I SAM-dependent methyltransferase [Saccharothrix longispora]|uniref:class I SAM-dependent methyltransferase n=1 Tax=Saccharothrix longispora TaxID=33920 RepID=UPI0028FD4116|nr:class I SAM-dependent methyltransferase [Saccharothrix longispora]MBY8851997.1 methyltransferase domain-containing protein [Saccharothrix sp. MB29]MDU0290636.1 class I SAM-dependent methyltransferase [Saccharothrix longispora]